MQWNNKFVREQEELTILIEILQNVGRDVVTGDLFWHITGLQQFLLSYENMFKRGIFDKQGNVNQ